METVLNIKINQKWAPLALLAATFLSFGLLIPRLGFYWDDWPVIYLIHTQGTEGFWDFYQYDRPYSWWTYVVFAPWLGTRPIGWHLFTLILRWLTAVLIWLILVKMWRRISYQAFLTALLFAVCPIFLFQPVAVGYSQHWICFSLYFISMLCMLLAQDSGNRFWFFTLLSALTSILHLFTMEYFLGLELLRPLILWLYFRERHPEETKRALLRRIIQAVWVYVLVMVAYIIWRLFFLQLAGPDANRPILIDEFLDSPLRAVISTAEMFLNDLTFLFTSWFVLIDRWDIDLQRPFTLAVLLAASVAGIVFWLIVKRYEPMELMAEEDRWPWNAFVLGLAAIALGMLPVWAIGRQASQGVQGNRFSLAAMFGVCLVIVALLEWLTPRVKPKSALIGLLVFLATQSNLNNAKLHQLSWEKQLQFHWQLYWRAPFIEAHTPLISEGEIFPYVGLYSTSMAISTIYPYDGNPRDMPLWFFSYWEGLFKDPAALVSGVEIESGIRNYFFSGESRNSIILEFSPELNGCLHLFSSTDRGIRDVPNIPPEVSGLSNLQRVNQYSPVDGWLPPGSIFGPEPEHQWCYFYQKAELANQYGHWDEVLRLMEEAAKNNYSSSNAVEYLPWLRAQLRVGRYEDAFALTVRLSRISNKLDDPVCNLWLQVIQSQNTPPAELVTTFEKVKEKTSCLD